MTLKLCEGRKTRGGYGDLHPDRRIWKEFLGTCGIPLVRSEKKKIHVDVSCQAFFSGRFERMQWKTEYCEAFSKGGRSTFPIAQVISKISEQVSRSNLTSIFFKWVGSTINIHQPVHHVFTEIFLHKWELNEVDSPGSFRNPPRRLKHVAAEHI